MNRAAVIIAVGQAGSLPKLHAALDGAAKMKAWADANGVDPVIVFTDERGPVEAKPIKKAIEKLVDDDNHEQLFIYFAGHGVNLHYSEFWLLTGSPRDTQEAVNVASSMQLAKSCGIPHVVFVSDACRTAPEGIQAQRITGSEIFPNEARVGPQKAVDVFYASLLGEPALEIQNKEASASRYVSIYTDELVASLRGERPAVLTDGAPDRSKLYLRPQPLKRYLTIEVPKLIAAKLGPAAPDSQVPDAEILSDEFAFLQEFDRAALPAPPAPAVRGGPTRGARVAPRPAPPPPTAVDLKVLELQEALRSPLGSGAQVLKQELRGPGVPIILGGSHREAEEFGPMHFETDCGFKVRGAEISAASSAPKTSVQLLSPELVRVDAAGKPALNVLLEFTDGRAVLLPAIRDFIAALTFDGPALKNVSYEPSDTSRRWAEYVSKRAELTALRTLIASSVYSGTFRLESDDAPKLTERIRTMKGLDPTLGIYAAYSYQRLGKQDLIRDMQGYLLDDLQLTLFDIALLAEANGKRRLANKVFPSVPMLAQGWALLSAFDAWTPALKKLREHVTSSLWTVFGEEAIPLLRKTLKG
jgi:hypothetical protein